jgi:tetratricopeptide (TPR) repeat protein
MRDARPVPATRLFGAAARHDPSLPGLDRNLGMAAFRARRYELAAEALTRVVETVEGGADVEARRTLALSLVNLDRYPEAADLLADDPGRAGDPSLQYAYALSLVRSDRDDQRREAEVAFERLFREHPEWPELHVLLGQAKAKEGDFPGARETLRHALELRADVPEAWFTLGEIHLRQGELPQAIAAFEAELAHTPGALQARYQLAVALDLADRPEDALRELGVVLRQRPTFADGRYLLGKVLLGEGRAAEAKSHLLAAAGEAPGDPNIHYQLALAHQRLGETDAAEAEFERYRTLKAVERGDT